MITIAIDFKRWLAQKLAGGDSPSPVEMSCMPSEVNLAYRAFALNLCINHIAQTLSLGEFLTFEKGKEVRGDLYYLLNVSPNQNRNATHFWREVVERLVYHDEALIYHDVRAITQNGEPKDRFFLARSYDRQDYAMIDNRYSEVDVGTRDAPYILREKYIEERDVLVLRWHNHRLHEYMNNMYQDLGKLISSSTANYEKNASVKGILSIGTDFSKRPDAQEKLQELMDRHTKAFFKSQGSALLPLTKGLEFQELSGSSTGQSSSNMAREPRGFVDDVLDLTAMTFGIPPSLLKSDFADLDNVVKQYLTFCINPIAEMITDEINRKLYTKNEYLSHTYAKLDTTCIRAVDIKDIASSLDILTRIGANTIDDSLRALGREPRGDDIGTQRFMTKNYAPVEDVIEQKGGLSNGDEQDTSS